MLYNIQMNKKVFMYNIKMRGKLEDLFAVGNFLKD